MAVVPPVVRSTATTNFNITSAGADQPIPMPAGVAVGDYLLIFFRTQSGEVGAHPILPGFTMHYGTDFGSSIYRYQAIFGKAINVAGDIPTGLQMGTPVVAGNSRSVVVVVAVSGVDLSNPLAGVTTNVGSVAGSTVTRSPMDSSVGALDFFVGMSEFGTGNTHIPTVTPADYTEVFTAIRPDSGDVALGRTYMWVGSKTSDSEVSFESEITWGTPSGAAAIGISLEGIGDDGEDPNLREIPHVVGGPTYAGVTGTNTSFTISRPSGVKMGDLLVVYYRTNGSNSPDDFACPGFTRVGTPWIQYSAEQRVSGFQAKVVGDVRLEPPSYTFTKSIGDTRIVAAMFIVRNAELPDFVVGESSTWTTASPNVTIDSFPRVAAPSLTLAAFSNEETAGYPSVPVQIPAGFTTVANQNQLLDLSSLSGTRTTLWVGSSSSIEAGMSGDITLQWGVNSGNGNSAFTIHGKVKTPALPGLPITLPDGRTGRAFYYVGGQKREPSALRVHVNEYPGVQELLATQGATMAHRGGSTSWPEMSEYAYNMSVSRGYRWLEFSAQRSTDGWWFGLHDNNFDRTSFVTESLPPSFYTRSEIEANFRNHLNGSGVSRPYYGMEDFINKYSVSNVLMLDPKNALGFTSEFLDILDVVGPERIIVKYFGIGSGSIALANAATARGYETWGYFYEPDVADGDLAANQEHWSILGMNWDASQAAWDAVKSYGKPVIAHICATQEQYDIAIAKGADLVQCSGVSEIIPVTP